MDGVQRLLAGVIRTVIVDAASDDPATRAEALAIRHQLLHRQWR